MKKSLFLLVVCFFFAATSMADTTQTTKTQLGGWLKSSYNTEFDQLVFFTLDGEHKNFSYSIWLKFTESPKLNKAYVDYGNDEISVRVGYLSLPLIYFIPTPDSTRTYYDPFDPWIYSFQDIGIILSGNHGLFGFKAGFVNGNGLDEDNNNKRDILGRVSFQGPFQANFYWQGGEQPDGYRATQMFDFSANLNSMNKLYGGYFKRIDLKRDGYLLGWIFQADPKVEIVTEFLQEYGNNRFTLGSNIFPEENIRIQPNLIFGDQKPEFTAQFIYSF